MSGTWSNFQFILWKHITLICQRDKLPLVTVAFLNYISFEIVNRSKNVLGLQNYNHVHLSENPMQFDSVVMEE